MLRKIGETDMDQPGNSRNIREIAERLVVYETAQETSGATTPAAAQVCEKLTRLLGKVIGVVGSRTLLARALSIAKRETTALATVSITDKGALEGITGEAAEASPVLVAHLIGLLVTFLGEALTLRLLHDVWPDRAASDIHLGERNGNDQAQ